MSGADIRKLRWKAELAFRIEIVRSVLPDPWDHEQELTDSQLREIAERSPVPYWTDGETLWTMEEWMTDKPNVRKISAAEALTQFGLEGLWEAREKGSFDG